MFFPRQSRTLSLLLMLLLGGFLGWEIAIYNVQNQIIPISTPDTKPSQTEEVTPLDLSLFWDVYDLLDKEYVDPTKIDDEAQLYGAIKGLVKSLEDPYSEFMTPTETSEFENSLAGTLQGIGAELTMKDNNLTVVTPLKGSPAEEKGLRSGDIIYMIDDAYASDFSLFEAISKIRGEEGTVVKLTLFREGETDPIVLEIERKKIDLPSVELEYKGKNNDIAYISISQFGDKTSVEFDNIVTDLLLRPVNGIVLDLRYNGGGYLDAAVDILSDFLEGKQVAVINKQREDSEDEILYTNESARLSSVPLVVLVNEGSASASEILAGAIQDYKRGLIMGAQTFGKGSVQVVEPFRDGSSLRVTIAKWYTPNDRSISDVGITPDTVVTQNETDFENEIDTQLEAAIDYLE
ncbi:MAG: S41 family peptidase [Candidatus Gracilibacteria bacterium]